MTKETLTANRFGMFYVKTKDNKITNIRPFEGDAYPNEQIQAFKDMVQNDLRVKYPMVRKSYLEAKGFAKNELRGKDEFVRVSWDKALSLAAKALREAHEKHGSESIYGECYWWGGSGKVGYGRTLSRRMLNILGGFVEESGDYSCGAGLVIMPHIVGESAVYGKSTKWKTIHEYSKNVVFWGTNPIITLQTSSKAPDHKGYEELKRLKESEIKTFSVDCQKNETSRYLNSKHIEIIPGTDVSLMIGMAHYLYTNNLYDKEFIQNYTQGFEKFKDYFLGKDDGVKKDIKWASNICGVDAEKIAWFSKILASKRSIIILGYAMQRQDNGEQVHWMATVLSAMLGYIGLKGGGIDFALSYSSNGGCEKKAPSLNGISEKVNKEAKNITIPSSRLVDALTRPNEMLEYNGKNIKLPHIRVMYNASGSPLTRHQDTNRFIKALRNVETIITAEPYWTSMAKMSDIVFPVAMDLERDDIIQSGANLEYIIARKTIVKPVGMSKSDFWICKELCKRWGKEKIFTEGKSEFEWVKKVYEDANLSTSFKEFWDKGYVRFSEERKEVKDFVRFGKFRENPEKHKLKTPSGKIEIFSKTIHDFGYDNIKGHPTWIEPVEWLGDKEKSANFPLHVISPHSKYRLHSQLNNSSLRNNAEINNREPMLINPKDAQKRGLKTGDIGRVFNARGEILVGVHVTTNIRENVISICEGAWYSPEVFGENSLCQHGNVNVLTLDKGSSKIAQSNIAHTALVEVEKYKGKLKPLKAFKKPKIL